MANRNRMKLAGSFMAVALAAGLTQGCSAADDEACEINSRIESFTASLDGIVAAEAELRAQLAFACAQIAGDDSVSENNDVDSDQLTTLCGEAEAAIRAQVEADLVIEIVPPVCEVNIAAQASCEAECEAEFQCEGGDIEARCEGGEVSVKCEGSCEASGRCEATAQAPSIACEGSCAGTCEGSCEGTCNGSCEGTCNGKCEGECSGGTDEEGNCNGECMGECQGSCEGSCSGSCGGTCMGECEGSCEVQPGSASVDCEGEFRCEGSCEGEATAPKCSGSVEPIECEGDAGCNADCEASASADASCTEGTIAVSGGADAEVVAAIQAHLGTILEVQGKLVSLTSAIGTTLEAGAEVSAELTTGCVAVWAGELEAKLSAALDASVNVSVSVQASAEVSGSAGGG
ncbi:MAG TPA: hypothetical protein VFU02_25085 [Polyangiaceae bacterium]|nr:hypothetical protein [Polyangiaceae bacterium]